MNILVTGGAGYVGSVVVDELIKRRNRVVVLDNLNQGHMTAVSPEADFVQADLLDNAALEGVFRLYEFEAVLHMAADTVVSQSVSEPRKFFQNNVIGSVSLLDQMLKHKVFNIIFSSSAAVYGTNGGVPISEDAIKSPVNAYGDSKLMFETILSRYGEAYGLRYICLRYFNAAGATLHLGEDHSPETHLIPMVLNSAFDDTPVSVFGVDYPTADGTCVRDFVHVEDIASANILALERLDEYSGRVFNLGNQRGYSIFEVLNKVREITGRDIAVKKCDRRSGDPATLIASSISARQELGWDPGSSDLDTIIRSAWAWKLAHPSGYGSHI